MYWSDRLIEGLAGFQVINDSKTPSGRVHVGALRGVLIHDAVYRSARDRGLDVRYRFGVDDYDPLDELPAGHEDEFYRYLGQPLCNVPAPKGSSATDIAEHYITEFFEVFLELGVAAETYRMRDIYRHGEFNSVIDLLLRHASTIRQIDREISGARRPDDWLPLQVICERCGRIGTTRAMDYDGNTVAYVCETDFVKWATGCGNKGRISPFNGNGKLSWKFEWVAKWHEFGVTVEGAGKDHNAKGGSRAVAARTFKEIFGSPPPLNIPYEFFLVEGAKMSSSRGIGVSARDMGDFLPSEVLRFLMLRAQPKSAVDFSPAEHTVVQLFNDFDRHRTRSLQGAATQNERRVYEMSVVDRSATRPSWAPPFDTVLSVVQMPHLDSHFELEKLKGQKVDDAERREIEIRVRAARYWLEHFAEPEDRQELKLELPSSVANIPVEQRGALKQLEAIVRTAQWDPEELQGAIFEAARMVPVEQRDAFSAVYRVFLDRCSGPKAGNLLAFVGKRFVLQRLEEVPFSPREFLLATAIDAATAQSWLESLRKETINVEISCREIDSDLESLDITITLRDGKRHARRVAVTRDSGRKCFDIAQSLRSESTP